MKKKKKVIRLEINKQKNLNNGNTGVANEIRPVHTEKINSFINLFCLESS